MDKPFRIKSAAVPLWKPSLAFVLLCVLMAALTVAGGASRASVAGQVVVRGAAWLLFIVAVLLGERPTLREARPIAWVLATGALLALLQLVPLPPALWQALPGRELMRQDIMAATSNVWRPWALVPGATMNALSSLVVPATTLWLVASLRSDERDRLLPLVLGFVLVATVVGLLQASASGIDNPFVNETVGVASGPFANRNHFALLLAIGCLVATAWTFQHSRWRSWSGAGSLGLVLLFLLTILLTGSRAGALLGGLALGIALLLSHTAIRGRLRGRSRWISVAVIAGIFGLVAVFVLVSVMADRAMSVDRFFAVDTGQDMRSRGLPTVLTMVRQYFPVGSGLGGFDPVFRMHEPFHLLKPTYFNHAHNDFIEVVLDAGLPGLVLLVAALGWWAWASIRAWRGRDIVPRLGSAILFLVILASTVDYPARTPLIMAITVIAAVWLSGHSRDPVRSTSSHMPLQAAPPSSPSVSSRRMETHA